MTQLEIIKTRRSTRKYTSKPVEEAKLTQVIEAGRFAPTASNKQQNHFIVIRNKEVLGKLKELVKDTFAGMEEGDNSFINHAISRAKTTDYTFHYNAPVLIVLANDISYPNSYADCSCSAENMMLMANELDLGSCWINQLRWLNDNEDVKAYLRTLGMGENETVFASVAVGYADTEDGLPVRTYAERTGNPVTYVD